MLFVISLLVTHFHRFESETGKLALPEMEIAILCFKNAAGKLSLSFLPLWAVWLIIKEL